MTSERAHHEHDWHSAECVNEWISSDVTRDNQRRPVLRQMLSLAGFRADASIEVLDVGGGYGLLSGVVLEAFANARVTLQDHSTPMLEQAKQRLATFAGRASFALADLTNENWTAAVGGSFDLAVSAIAIHNLRDPQLIERVYESVRSVLKPDGVFLDADYVFAGGFDAHLDMLRQARFERVSCELKDERLAVFAAYATE